MKFNEITYYQDYLLSIEIIRQGQMFYYFLFILISEKKTFFCNNEIIYYVSITFLLKTMWNIFLPYTYCAVTFVVVALIVAETAFRGILRMICHTDFTMCQYRFLRAEEASKNISIWASLI